MSSTITHVLIGGKNLLIGELSNELLADAYGDARTKESLAKDDKDAVGKEVKRRRRKKFFGFRYSLTVSKFPRETLDGDKLRKFFGDKIKKYLNTTRVTKINCTARQAKGKAA